MKSYFFKIFMADGSIYQSLDFVDLPSSNRSAAHFRAAVYESFPSKFSSQFDRSEIKIYLEDEKKKEGRGRLIPPTTLLNEIPESQPIFHVVLPQQRGLNDEFLSENIDSEEGWFTKMWGGFSSRPQVEYVGTEKDTSDVQVQEEEWDAGCLGRIDALWFYLCGADSDGDEEEIENKQGKEEKKKKKKSKRVVSSDEERPQVKKKKKTSKTTPSTPKKTTSQKKTSPKK